MFYQCFRYYGIGWVGLLPPKIKDEARRIEFSPTFWEFHGLMGVKGLDPFVQLRRLS
jgi:hypothetical protein